MNEQRELPSSPGALRPPTPQTGQEQTLKTNSDKNRLKPAATFVYPNLGPVSARCELRLSVSYTSMTRHDTGLSVCLSGLVQLESNSDRRALLVLHRRYFYEWSAAAYANEGD